MIDTINYNRPLIKVLEINQMSKSLLQFRPRRKKMSF